MEANTLVLNSFYESHGGNIGEFDYGYDITDHMAVNAEAGTMADFEALLADAHSRGKVVELLQPLQSLVTQVELFFL